ncbi:protein timeless homolog [Phalaenopsis equestris]|uniref:protein timeless homolog n=1 Tax=Phalaenopsis equestris TaxID=78828 RepID=UPI0009E3500B|nr:protein timeless homolog [Phalaenopsis equestris]
MNTEGLSSICSGLGIADEDDNGNVKGYTKTEYCLDNLKDLQRFLRRDDPQRRDVFKQTCRWNTVSRDLVPIIEHYQSDKNLVISAVKILVFLTMPVDSASEDVALQIEYLWELKAALTREVAMAVIVSILEEPLGNLESGTFTEDDWKLVQLVLTLFRNILAIQDITAQQKASGHATQFFHLTDRFLEIMFQENTMELILVLAQHIDDPNGFLRQDNLLLLEIFHYILLGREPELVAKAFTIKSKANAGSATSDSLRSIIKAEDEKRKLIKQRNAECHQQFSGTFTRLAMDGSKMLFNDPASASTNGLAKVRKVQRGPMKKVASENRVLSLQEENILGLLHNFLNQFLHGGYNVLMQTIRDDIIKEQQEIQKSDIITYFQVIRFITAFHHKKILTKRQNMENMEENFSINSQSVDYLSLHEDLCGPIAATMNEAMFFLVISKWREASDGVKITNDYKFLTAAGSLMKNMVRVLDLVMKLLPVDSKECQTARVLLYKLFYDQTDEGLTQFLMNRFKCFDSHKQPRSDLADLLEIIHIMLRLMEKLQAHGTLRVSKKFRRRKVRNKSSKDKTEAEPEFIREPEIAHEHVEHISEMCIDPANSVKEKHSELNSIEGKLEIDQEGIMNFNPAAVLDDEENEKPADQEYETSSSSNTEEAATNEVNFSVSALVSNFASNTIIHNLCWLLKYYKANSASTNHYILCMLNRFCEDLELSPMLYQLSLLTIFYDILAEQNKCKSKDYMNIINFLTKFLRKMFKIMRSQPLLFVEILFWKTRRECQFFNAEVLMESIGNLRKDLRKMVGDSNVGFSRHGDMGYRSIADALGDDEIDLDLPPIHHDQMAGHSSDSVEGNSDRIKGSQVQKRSEASASENETNMNRSEITPSSPQIEVASRSRRKRVRAFNKEEELQITILYEKFKDHKKRNVMIANALNPDQKFTAAQVSRKLKELGLLPHKKSSSVSGKHNNGNEISEVKDNSDEETLLAFRERSNKKKRVPGMHAITMTSSSLQQAALRENDSDDMVLSSFLTNTSAKRKPKPSVADQDVPEATDSETWAMNNTPIELDRGKHIQLGEISASNQDMQVVHSELEDSMDSADDMGPVVPRKMKRMILDFEEDDDD